MGYHVSIVRTRGAQRLPITLEEATTALVGTGEWRLEAEGDAFAATGLPEGEERLRLADGELWAKTPSEAMLARMIQAAAALGGRVRGDELETYESVDKWYCHPDDEAARGRAAKEAAALKARRSRRLWIIRAVLATPLLIAFVRWALRQ